LIFETVVDPESLPASHPHLKLETEGEDDPDVQLSQNDYNKALGNLESDDYYDRFLSRIRKGNHSLLALLYA
jgi:hypothetical protein